MKFPVMEQWFFWKSLPWMHITGRSTTESSGGVGSGERSSFFGPQLKILVFALVPTESSPHYKERNPAMMNDPSIPARHTLLSPGGKLPHCTFCTKWTEIISNGIITRTVHRMTNFVLQQLLKFWKLLLFSIGIKPKTVHVYLQGGIDSAIESFLNFTCLVLNFSYYRSYSVNSLAQWDCSGVNGSRVARSWVLSVFERYNTGHFALTHM